MLTSTKLKRLSALCACALLLACTSLDDQPKRRANDMYTLGRTHHLAHRYDEALHAYEEALKADAQHIDARNGLAAIYAERGAFDQAIRTWEALTKSSTVAAGPADAYLFNNLGYAYFLKGDYKNAATALEKASLLDPMSYSASYHLGESYQKLGQVELAKRMFDKAKRLRGGGAEEDAADEGGSSAHADLVAGPDDGWAMDEIVTREESMLELRRVPARGQLAQNPANSATATFPVAYAATATFAPGPRATQLEIRNGNGVTGMGRSVARQMGDPYIKVVRLTNQNGFNVRSTRVEYRTGFRPAAERLAQRFDSAALVHVGSFKRTEMRLVLGRDIAGPKFVLRPLPAQPSDQLLADAKGIPPRG
jgi:Flp pilus assembly protein TadD